uniref:Glycoprotein m6b n=1 Tax=Mus musculus TaxID=10090 RepID=H3BIV8_MOUSE
MKPAMETAAEENTEQSQERKVNSRAEMEIGRYHWMYPGSKNHQYRPVPTLGDRAGPLSSPGSKNAKHLAKAGIANRFRMPHLSLGRWDC